MDSTRRSRLLPITGLLLGVLVWLANNANPPTGNTGAPFNGHCNSCHTGNTGGFDGTVEISGLPGTIEANTTYPITLTMTPTAGSPTKGGFQLVMVNGSNANAGNLASVNGETGTEFLSTREYVEHRNGKDFNGNPISWNFNWTSPITAAGNTIKAYFIGNFTNGNNQNTGDYPIAFLETFDFNGPPPVVATIISTTNVSCAGGNNGSATVEASGGAPPYTYLWSNGQTGQTAVNLTAGNYTVTVTGSGGSGTATASTPITQPSVLNASATASGNINCIVTQVNVTANASGGTGPYEFNWSNGTSGNPTAYDTPGSHTVTVTDDNGCTKTASFNIGSNLNPPTANIVTPGVITCTQPQISLSGAGSSTGPNFSYLWTASNGGNIVTGATTLNPVVNACGTYTLQVTNASNGCTSVASTNVSCNVDPPSVTTTGGTLTCAVTSLVITATSGTSGVTYAWSGPGGFTSTLQNPTVSLSGSYIVTVTNPVNSCTNIATATVNQNTTPPTANATVSGTLTCSTTSVQLNITTNASFPTFAWTGPNGFSSTQQSPSVTAPGSYIGTVTNPANGCSKSDTIAVTQNIAPPGATASATGQITCTNLTVQLNGSSPASPVTYAWSGPNGFTSTLQNPVANTTGTYTLTVTSGTNGCTSTASTTVTPNTTPPGATATVTGQITCTNLTVQLNGSSPVSPVTYAWSGPNGFTSTLQNPVANTTGTYTLTVTSGTNGCTSTSTATVTANTTPPTASIAPPGHLNCNTSTVQLNGTGSSQGPNFTYAWTTTNGNIVSGASTLTPIVDEVGTYTLLVTNTGNGCTSTANATVTQTPPVTASATATQVSCNGGSNGTAIATPGGGAGTFTYAWSNGGTTATIANLPAGTYTVTVTDAENCTAAATATVNQPAILLANATATGESSNGSNDGTATAVPTGGTPTYTYNWSNGGTTATINNLAPGNYTVTVSDASACTAVQTVTVNSFNCPLSATIASTNVTCNGANNGTATVNLMGAASPVTYTWSNGGTTPTISNLTPGSYSVSVLDGNGCPASLTVSITEPLVLSANATATAETMLNANDGSATAQPTGGTPVYAYAWSNGGTMATITNLAPGSYTVTVTDVNSCTAVQSVIVNAFNCSVTANISSSNVSCAGGSDGQATVTLNGGTLPFTYLWSNGDTTATISNLTVGVYSVTVTDDDGCVAIQSANIISADTQAPTISCPAAISRCGADVVTYATPAISDNCSLTGIQPILVSGLPSGSPFNDGVTTQVFQVTDASGNTATCSFSITVNPIPDVLLGMVKNDSIGLGIGSINVTPVGGLPPYTFSWLRNGIFYSNEEDLDSLNAGTYLLTVKDSNGCEVILSAITIGNTVGTVEPGKTVIRLWPNPARTALQLDMGELQPASGQIFTPQGRLIQEVEPSDLSGEISVAHLPGGLYYLKVTTRDGQIQVLKWMKAD